MSHQKQNYYYNEHDENQVKKILVKKKKKRLKRRVKVLLFLFICILIGYYFVSDISKVKLIQVIGNEDVSSKEIIEASHISEESYFLFVNTSKVSQTIKELPLIKKAVVKKHFSRNITIEIQEAEKVACCEIKNKTYIIDELGRVSLTTNKKVIEQMQSSLKLSSFEDVDFLKRFALEYIKLPDIIKSQTSDILYSPQSGDESRLKFVMNNGKILYLRVEDMVKQLESFDYEANMTAYGDRCTFSFEGKHVYMEKCK